MFEKRYLDQVGILLNILPLLNKYKDFAIKGGTAINFFVFEAPRLSVDIDLCFLPIKTREQTFIMINEAMSGLEEEINRRFPGYSVNRNKTRNTNVYKLTISNNQGVIKIEPNELLRGSVNKPISMKIKKEIARIFNLYPEVQVLSVADLFGGKICAALDRQHPRDLFDICMMFRNNLFSEEIRKAFLVYLIQSNRPISELLHPNKIDIKLVFERDFIGMVGENISLDLLYETREQLIKSIRSTLTDDEKNFLLSVKRGEPEWHKLGIGDFSHFPGVKWKILNIKKMNKRKRIEAYKKLEKVLAFFN